MSGPLQGLARSSLVYGAANAAARAVGLVLVPFYTAALAPSDYGALATLQVISALVAPVLSLGIGVSLGLCYHEQAGGKDRERVIWSALALASVPVGVLVACGLAFAPALGGVLFPRPDSTYAVQLALVTLALGSLAQPLVLGLQLREEAAAYSVISVLTAVLGGVVGLVLVLRLGRGIAGVLEAQLAAQSLALVLFLWTGLSRPVPDRIRSAWRPLLKRGLPMVPSFLALFAMQQGNQLLLKELRGLDELGIYSVGYSLGSALGLAVSSFTTAWTPFFLAYTSRIPDAQQLFPRVLTYYVAGFGALTLLFFAWAQPVVRLLLPEAYWASAGVIGFSALGQALIGCFSILVVPLYFAKNVSAVSVMQIASAGLALAANLFLVHRWGYMGAAIGLPVGYALMCAFVHEHLTRHPDRYVRFNYDWKRIGGIASIYCLAAMLVIALPAGGGEIPRSLIATVLVAVIAFMMLPKQERRTIRAKAIGALRRQS